MSFERAYKIVLRSEGGYVNDKADRGGATMMGVTQQTYDGYRAKHRLPKKPVKGIQHSEVEEIYRSGYWNPCKCDQLPPKLAILLFDYAINSGPARACKALQVVLGFQGKDVDGALGQKSFAAIAKWKDEALCDALLEYRADFYRRIIKGDPTQRRFERGWMNRIEHLRKVCHYLDKLPLPDLLKVVFG